MFTEGSSLSTDFQAQRRWEAVRQSCTGGEGRDNLSVDWGPPPDTDVADGDPVDLLTHQLKHSPVRKSSRFCWDHLEAGGSKTTMEINRQAESKIGLVQPLALAALAPTSQRCLFPFREGVVRFRGA